MLYSVMTTYVLVSYGAEVFGTTWGFVLVVAGLINVAEYYLTKVFNLISPRSYLMEYCSSRLSSNFSTGSFSMPTSFLHPSPCWRFHSQSSCKSNPSIVNTYLSDWGNTAKRPNPVKSKKNKKQQREKNCRIPTTRERIRDSFMDCDVQSKRWEDAEVIAAFAHFDDCRDWVQNRVVEDHPHLIRPDLLGLEANLIRPDLIRNLWNGTN